MCGFSHIKIQKKQEIEDKIEKLIGESENDDLMAAWLEYLNQKKVAAERLELKISKKDPVLIGALIGAVIGSLFDKQSG